jgi:hypothetical protein
MGLFGNGHAKCDERMDALERAVSTLKDELKRTRMEASELYERSYRNLKKSEARARRELDEGPANQGPRTTTGRAVTPSGDASSSHRAQWGPRARRLARLSRRDPSDEGDAEQLDLNVTE